MPPCGGRCAFARGDACGHGAVGLDSIVQGLDGCEPIGGIFSAFLAREFEQSSLTFLDWLDASKYTCFEANVFMEELIR